MSSTTTSIDFDGPFFTRDPGLTVMLNVQKMMQGIAEEGAAIVRERMLTGQGQRALVRLLDDRVRDHVVGRTRSVAGKQWYIAAVVQVYNKGLSAAEGLSLMAAASYVERRTHAVRDVTRQLRAGAKAQLRANLTEGLE